MKLFFSFALFLLLAGCQTKSPEADLVGQPYKGWNPGELDIHHIQTGRGESNFLIFPDGTSLLIDAGDFVYKDSYPLRPDTTRRAGEWIARYIERVNPHKENVDYLMVSHFHNDHTGDCSKATVKTEGRDSDYLLCGIAEVGEYIHFKKAIDRGWPTYDYPNAIIDRDVDNYRAFLNWKIKTENLQAERFIVGSNNQLALLYDSAQYNKLFRVQNLVANGELWTGNGLETIKYYDTNPQNKEGWQNENAMSLGMVISYGPFKYFTGGDLSGRILDADGNDIDIEGKTAKLCGEVDVCKINHHGYLDATTESFAKNMNARNYIFPAWDLFHFQPSVMDRLISNSSDKEKVELFYTGVVDSLLQQNKEAEYMKHVIPDFGHIVVKVLPGGKQYKILILSNEDEQQTVKAIYGPYESKLATKE